tara:strand:- start:157 stop:414 length:258 start_codon:yes stop_codon:yes gene_type:complete
MQLQSELVELAVLVQQMETLHLFQQLHQQVVVEVVLILEDLEEVVLQRVLQLLEVVMQEDLTHQKEIVVEQVNHHQEEVVEVVEL